MKTLIRPYIVLAAALSLTGCAFLKEIGLDKAAWKLVQAVPDIVTDVKKDGGLKKHVEGSMCKIYSSRGRGFAELAWMHDWPVFEPLFKAPVTAPEADEEFCVQLIESRGAGFVTKSETGHGGTALRYVVALPHDYAERKPLDRAALMCHEAVHIVWQHRATPTVAAIDYATVSGRVAAEATAYSITEAMQRRHGVPDGRVVAARARRLNGFTERYKLGRTITDECLTRFFSGVHDAFRERSGL